MSEPTMTETDRARALTALPEAVREAMSDFEDAAHACGAWDAYDSGAMGRALDAKWQEAEDALVLAITAALARGAVYADIAAERARQDAQWGGPAHDDKHTDLDWQQFRAKFEVRALGSRTTPEARRDALVKIAALAVAQIESLDRRAALDQARGGEGVR